MQKLDKTPLFYLPVNIDIYIDGKVETKEVIIDKVTNTFTFEVNSKPDLVNFDADKMLLCEKIDNHNSIEEWAFMYNNAPRYLDRNEAIKKLSKSGDDIAIKTIIKALNDKYPSIRRTAIKGIKKAAKSNKEETKLALLNLAKNDENSKVRGDAMTTLTKHFKEDEAVKAVLINGLSEESYYVIGRALSSLSDVDYEDAMKFSKSLETEENSKIKNAVCGVYA